MPMDPSYVGRTYPPTPPYEVGREKIREFAEAVGDHNPAYLDPEAAKALGYPDVITPPTFPIIISLPAANQIIADPALGLDWARTVHGDQRFVYERPMRAGDRITATVTVDSVQSRAGNDLINLAAALRTTEGELVCTAYTLIVARGLEADAESPEPDPAPSTSDSSSAGEA
jgi:acyl dehydratase